MVMPASATFRYEVQVERVRRGDSQVWGGQAATLHRPDDVQIDEDPRTKDRNDYWLAHEVRDRRAHVVWIDPKVESLTSTLQKVDDLAADRPLVVAYRNVEQRVFTNDLGRRTHRFGGTSYVRNPPFENVHKWVAHLMQMPSHPPTDLHLHARHGTEQVRVAAGQEAALGPFIVRAEAVNWGIEWHRSVVALVRRDLGADLAALRAASAGFVSDGLRID